MDIKIRTVTLQSFTHSANEDLFKRFVTNLPTFAKEGYTPRTYRVVAQRLENPDFDTVMEYVSMAERNGFWGIGLPLDVSRSDIDSAFGIAGRFIQNDKVFINFLPVRENVINLQAVPRIAEFILQIGEVPVNNFRVGVSSSETLSPFFPFTCAKNDAEFVIGLELVGYITELVRANSRLDLSALRELIMSKLTDELEHIQKACMKFADASNVAFGGMDISLAPYPYPLEDQSIVSLIEELGKIARSRGESVYEFGSSGTHFLNTYITDILKYIVSSTTIKTVGFNGVMYSVLEDTYLSKRYAEDSFDINFLKLLSTTCGCGVDMIPLPGDTQNSTISGIVLDVLATGLVLHKPLGVRVLPIRGLRGNERTTFKHLFFANTIVKNIKEGATLEYLPGQQKTFKFKVDRR